MINNETPTAENIKHQDGLGEADNVSHQDNESAIDAKSVISSEQELDNGERGEVSRGGELTLEESKHLVQLIERVKQDQDNFQEGLIEIYKVIGDLPASNEVKQKANSAALSYMATRENLTAKPELTSGFLDVLSQIKQETGDDASAQSIIDKRSSWAVQASFESLNFGPAIEEYSPPEQPKAEVDTSLAKRLEAKHKVEEPEKPEADDQKVEAVHSVGPSEEEEGKAEPEEVKMETQEEPEKPEEAKAAVEPEVEVDHELEQFKREYEQGREAIENEDVSIREMIEKVNPDLLKASSATLGFEDREGYNRWLEAAKRHADTEGQLEQQAA